MKVKEESENLAYNLEFKKIKITAPNPITSWKRDGEKVETLTYFLLFGSKITADAGSSQKIKSYSPLGRKYITNLNRRGGVKMAEE